MKTKSLFTSLIVLLLSVNDIFGQSFDKARADSLFDLLAGKNKAMGSLAVCDNGNVIYARAVGYLETAPEKIPSNTKTKYRIGSISKMFTATLIFQLIDEGKLKLTTSLDKFFPTVPNSQKITIGNLLSHRSGIHSFTDDSAYTTYMTRPKTRQEMVKIISEGKPEFEPDAKTDYSNSNFVLLGYIVEDLRKEPYNKVLQKYICSKAGLTDTYYGSKTDIAKNECYSFQFGSEWEKQPETDMSIPHGAGAIVSTPTDLDKFISTLFSGKLISDASLIQMKTIKDGLGMGMMKFPYENKTLYGHGGAIDGFNSILCYFPDEKLAVSYISNGTVYPVNEILLRILNNYFNKPDKLPEFKTYIISPEDLATYTGVYSSNQIPIKLTISVKDGKLIGQGSGQAAFPLEATAKHEFKFDQAGIVMHFDPGKGELLLDQGGGKFTFTKEK
jgi:D-alanyl-D-alanine carboxypeptidase